MEQFFSNQGLLGGMVSILHTWGQNLSLHPHVHCIVPGGGIAAYGGWQPLAAQGKFLFAVKALSKVFRAKYVALLRAEKLGDKLLFDSLFAKDWVVYAKRPFGNANSVIEYLGRYTHKVAISNSRILSVEPAAVRFGYKDYRGGGQKKTMQLTPQEFARRFALHLLPKGFTRIRHYGFLGSGWKRGKLQALQTKLSHTPPALPVPTQNRRCPCCKTGQLATIALFGQRGPPLSQKVGAPIHAC